MRTRKEVTPSVFSHILIKFLTGYEKILNFANNLIKRKLPNFKVFMAKKQTKNKPDSKKQIYEGNLYDKIFKENAESIFLPLIEERLNVKIKAFIPYKAKLQTTIEREMDFFMRLKLRIIIDFCFILNFRLMMSKI